MTYETFESQDGGIALTIFSNSMAMANLVLYDNTASDELKMMVEQLQIINQELYNQLEKIKSDRNE